MIKASRQPAILGGATTFPQGLNLVSPDLPMVESLIPELQDIFATGTLTKGKMLKSFEEAVAQLSGTKEAVALSSCTTGLVLVHKLLGLEGEIILPSFTFMASALGAAWNRAFPVFVDIDPATWNIDPAKVREALSERTGAIVATHVFGNPADVDALQRIADEARVPLIFDAAHGFGARYKGHPLGGNGRCEVFSCSPTKLLICGEGGVVTTNDEELAYALRCAREYGNVGDYDLALPGLNGRMSELNALLGLKSLELLERAAHRRNYLVSRLKELVSDLPGLTWQKVAEVARSSYKDLACRIDPHLFGLSRDQLVQGLVAEGITTRNYYDPPCHQQTYWQTRGQAGPSGLAHTERLSKTAVTLPLSSRMTPSAIDGLAEALWRLHLYSAEIKRAIDQDVKRSINSIWTGSGISAF